MKAEPAAGRKPQYVAGVPESAALPPRAPRIAMAAPAKPSSAATTCSGRSDTPGSSTGASTTISSGQR
ncbi:hypothetical protein D3C72_2199360 [compost metagenome]